MIYCCCFLCLEILYFFFFNDTATTEIYTLSLHDALPISRSQGSCVCSVITICAAPVSRQTVRPMWQRSEEHTSELQSRLHLVCRLLLEKKKKNNILQDAKCLKQ